MNFWQQVGSQVIPLDVDSIGQESDRSLVDMRAHLSETDVVLFAIQDQEGGYSSLLIETRIGLVR